MPFFVSRHAAGADLDTKNRADAAACGAGSAAATTPRVIDEASETHQPSMYVLPGERWFDAELDRDLVVVEAGSVA